MASSTPKNDDLRRVFLSPHQLLTREACSGTFISLLIHAFIILIVVNFAFTIPGLPAKVVEIDFSIVQGKGTSGGQSQYNVNDSTVTKQSISRRYNNSVKKTQTVPSSRYTHSANERKEPVAHIPIPVSATLPDGTAIRGEQGTYADTGITGDSSQRTGSLSDGTVGKGIYGEPPGHGDDTAGGSGDGSGHGGSPLRKGKDYTYIRDAVMKNIQYPERAKRMGIEGKTLLSFIVLEDGTTSMITVLKSSGHSLLDESAKNGIARTIVPRKVAHRVVVHLPVAYKLHISNNER